MNYVKLNHQIGLLDTTYTTLYICVHSIMPNYLMIVSMFDLQSNLYKKVSFGTKKRWPYKTGDLIKEVQFI